MMNDDINKMLDAFINYLLLVLIEQEEDDEESLL
jgi:hypothetical protein